MSAFLPLVFLALIGMSVCRVHAIPPPTKQDLVAATERFNRIAWPSLKGKPYVEIPLGNPAANGETFPRVAVRGFLLSEDDNSWLLLPIGSRVPVRFEETRVWPYATQRIPKRSAQVVQARILSLNQVTNEMVQVIQDPTKQNGKPSAATVFAFARFCEASGSPDLAMRLDKIMPTQPDNTLGASFQKHVMEEIAMLLMWKAITDFGDLSISRSLLLPQLKFVADYFPESKHWKLACTYSEILPQMVEEDRLHSPKPLSAMSAQEQVDEFIFQLRNQNGQQLMQPGHCDIFGWPGSKRNTAAHELLKLGNAAVPSLIDAMTDKRPTRSVGFGRNFYFSHYVLTVGDCAERILSRHAGREFYDGRSSSAAMTKDGGTEAAQKAARDWWAGVQANAPRSFPSTRTKPAAK